MKIINSNKKEIKDGLIGLLLFSCVFLIYCGYLIHPFVLDLIFPGITKCGTLVFENHIQLTQPDNFTALSQRHCCNRFVVDKNSPTLKIIPAWYVLSSILEMKAPEPEFTLTDFRHEYIVFNNDQNKTLSMLSLDITKRLEDRKTLLIRLIDIINTIDNAGWQRTIDFKRILLYPTQTEILKQLGNGSKILMSWDGVKYNINLIVSITPKTSAKLVITPLKEHHELKATKY